MLLEVRSIFPFSERHQRRFKVETPRSIPTTFIYREVVFGVLIYRERLDLPITFLVSVIPTFLQATVYFDERLPGIVASGVFQFFIDIATRNGLGNTPSVQKLEDAQTIFRLGDNYNPGPATYRIVHGAAFQNMSILERSKHLVIQDIPLFNIWDCISFIYALCVEPITSTMHAECHLYQFSTIVLALCNTRYFPSYTKPSTGAAAWNVPPTEGDRVLIAFATTCVGRGDDKKDMIHARFQFINDLASTLQEIFSPQRTALIRPGNCPEYIVFDIVCRSPGQYRSLCLGVKRNKIFKWCNHCEDLAAFLVNAGINIEDYWNQTCLKTDDASVVAENEGYSFNQLKPFAEVFSLSLEITRRSM